MADLLEMKVPNEENDAPATTESAKTIKAIKEDAVHRICSGQVILTLATAAKELIENSLDAGATSIDIRLKDYGGTLIEVNDNGHGVDPANFASLTLKHYTSKLENFVDLIEVTTFGFRGEALSSLCALSSMCITTRHKNQSVGSKLLYNGDGKILEEIAVSRQVGSSVTLSNIFSTLPVRYKEFHRNVKKEFGKFVQILYAYCIISTNIRISCTNQCDKGKKKVIVSTDGYANIRDNIISIFGTKQVSTLVELVDAKSEEDVAIENENIDIFHVDGYISSCAHGSGRSAPDRQFYFINGRPCDPNKISRLVNEVYHQYNRHQYPMVVLRITIKSGNVDVNVTPDKRQIMINREKGLLSKLKNMLISSFQDIPSSYNVENSFSSLSSSQDTLRFSPSSAKTTSSPSENKISQLMQKFSYSPVQKIENYLNKSEKDESKVKRCVDEDCDSDQRETKVAKLSSEKIETVSVVEEIICKEEDIKMEDESILVKGDDVSSSFLGDSTLCTPQVLERVNKVESGDIPLSNLNNGVTPSRHLNKIHSKTEDFLNSLKKKIASGNTTPKSLNSLPQSLQNFAFKKQNSSSGNTKEVEEEINSIIPEEFVKTGPDTIMEDLKSSNSDRYDVIVLTDDIIDSCNKGSLIKPEKFYRKTLTISCSLDSIHEKLKKNKNDSNEIAGRKFLAKITPTDNNSAQEELKKEITKDMFKMMKVIGQFNLGFIIVRLNSDLFIIDQHASDEKYNFETLQSSFVLQKQKLLFPQKLELSVNSESILISNLEIFQKNGFDFAIDESKPYGQRVSLSSLPYSKGWEFNKEDVDELIFMLSDADGVMCRPSRVRLMFASRACRKSVMIGSYLNKTSMKKLVLHMGEIEQPWNCPHGRPTMRHLVNIDVVTKLGS